MGYETYGITTTVGDGLEAIPIITAALNSFSSLISIAIYLLLAFGLYTIAQRREIKNPWMAFLPVVNLWILGSIADQYQYVKNGMIRNRRKTLLILNIVLVILAIILFIVLFGFIFNLFTFTSQYQQYEVEEVLYMMLGKLALPLGVGLVYSILALVIAIVQWICYYELFASCDPSNKTLYLILGILIAFLMPVFVFVCRNKDLGMPPRRVELPTVEAEQPQE